MLIYIAGPYTAETREEQDENVALAASAARALWAMGHAAICPHLNTYNFESFPPFNQANYQQNFETFLTGDLEMISRCDGVYMLPRWETSRGACAEYAFAKWLGVPVFTSMLQLREAAGEGV